MYEYDFYPEFIFVDAITKLQCKPPEIYAVVTGDPESAD